MSKPPKATPRSSSSSPLNPVARIAKIFWRIFITPGVAIFAIARLNGRMEAVKKRNLAQVSLINHAEKQKWIMVPFQIFFALLAWTFVGFALFSSNHRPAQPTVAPQLATQASHAEASAANTPSNSTSTANPSEPSAPSAVTAIVETIQGLAPAATAPSFNCEHAQSATERAICQSPDLVYADVQMDRHYQIALRPGGDTATRERADQARWLSERDLCGSDEKCIKDAYARRMKELTVDYR